MFLIENEFFLFRRKVEQFIFFFYRLITSKSLINLLWFLKKLLQFESYFAMFSNSNVLSYSLAFTVSCGIY